MLTGVTKFFRGAFWAMALIPMGIILAVVSIFAFKSVDRIKNFPETEAVVSKTELVQEAYTDADGDIHDATYKVFLKYTVEGKEYETEYGEFSNYKVDQKVTVKYNPDDPSDISQPNGIILPILLLAGGVASITIGIVTAVTAMKKNKKLKMQEKEWENGN